MRPILDMTYSVKWVSTNNLCTPLYVYLDYPFFEHQIHWFSVFNSFMMVIFLTGLVSMILMRTLRNDYAKYAREDDDLETLERSNRHHLYHLLCVHLIHCRLCEWWHVFSKWGYMFLFHCKLSIPNMSWQVVLKIVKLLEVNPYSSFFRSLQQNTELHECKIVLRADPGLDQRTYNIPTTEQVAAIWKDSNGYDQSEPRDIRVYTKSGHSKKIEYYYGCYVPLQYPLLFPRAEHGWHVGIRRNPSDRIGSGNRTRYCEGQNLAHPSHVSSGVQLLRA